MTLAKVCQVWEESHFGVKGLVPETHHSRAIIFHHGLGQASFKPT